MNNKSIKEFLSNQTASLLVDVRSPAEFASGHIPGALNLPLFSDKEREIVGTTYKQNSPEKALYLGLDIVGPKMSDFIKTIRKHKCKHVTVHCWRGGKRSQSMAWLLNFAGISADIIQGGYKEYRRYILSADFVKDLNIVILGGRTGMGKTAFIQELKRQGEQVIDLELLARHKGSAFGHLGEEPPPTNEQFENNVAQQILQIDTSRRIWVENESRMIGGIVIAQEFWNKMKQAPLLNIEVNESQRMKNILRDYGNFTREELAESFHKIEKRIGGQNLKIAVEAINAGDLESAVHVALKYYDKTYDYNLSINNSPAIHKLTLPGDDIVQQTSLIIEYADRNIRIG